MKNWKQKERMKIYNFRYGSKRILKTCKGQGPEGALILLFYYIIFKGLINSALSP